MAASASGSGRDGVVDEWTRHRWGPPRADPAEMAASASGSGGDGDVGERIQRGRTRDI